MKHYFLYLPLLLQSNLYGQPNPGPRISAMGMTGVALQDYWSIQSNQAGLAAVRKPFAAGAYQAELFNPDVTTQSLILVIPDKRNVFALGFETYGFSAYCEQRLGFALARNFGNSVYAALNFNFHLLKIAQYGKTETYSFELGLQYKLSEELVLGTHVSNPSLSNYENQLAALPAFIEFGAAYRLGDKLLLSSSVNKALYSVTDIRAGFEFSAGNNLDLRGGLSVNPFSQYAGLGFRQNRFRVDAAITSHAVIGSSPQIAIGYEF